MYELHVFLNIGNICTVCTVLCRPGTTAGNQCCYKDGKLCKRKGCGGTINKVAPTEENKCRDHYFEDILPAMSECPSYLQKRPIYDVPRYTPPPPPGIVHA